MGHQDTSLDSFKTVADLDHDGRAFRFYSLPALADATSCKLEPLPYSIRVLLENLLRHEDGTAVSAEDITALANWHSGDKSQREIFFMPARVLLQDFTGVPAVADLAAMRSAIQRLGGDPARINPFTPADLVIDHSVQVDRYGSSEAFRVNAIREFERNTERYQFLRWGQNAFANFRVVPPDSGIVHQVNIEHLARGVMQREDGEITWLYPDTLIGTDSHTTMINGLGVLGWGVGGIEAEAALLDQPVSLLIPEVVGFRLEGTLPGGTTATDLVLTIVETLRRHGVVGKFVEFFGPALGQLTVADRATIANMAPEYGATMGFFPVDERTVDYFHLTGRAQAALLMKAYCHSQKLWFSHDLPQPDYTEVIEFDLGSIVTSLAGPSRPQDRVSLGEVRNSFQRSLMEHLGANATTNDSQAVTQWQNEGGSPVLVPPELATLPVGEERDIFSMCSPVRQPDGVSYNLCHGSVVIAAITSCTNTSNPSVMMAAGLLARNSIRKGLQVKPWVKTSLAPGSQVVTDYLAAAGLMPYLEALRFHLVAYGCTTCIGNSGPLPPHICKAIQDGNLSAAAVLSGNRNFEGRVNAMVRANYLASPPLVVAYALAGNIGIDLTRDPLGSAPNGEYVYLQDIWPDRDELEDFVHRYVTAAQYTKVYAQISNGSASWNALSTPEGQLYQWDPDSTYIKEPPFLEQSVQKDKAFSPIRSARVLALLGNSVTTDHISPAGSIAEDSPAGRYLREHGVEARDFNSYGARRGNHEVMARGTFANVRLRNQLVPDTEGGFTAYLPEGRMLPIYDAAMQYQSGGIPLIIIAGREYGTGSSRDWAAKGPKLLGVRAVLAESFERIHRSNLVGMGILPLEFGAGDTRASLDLDGRETYDILVPENLEPGADIEVVAVDENGQEKRFHAKCRIDTPNEIEYFRHGGILPYVLHQTMQ